MPTRRRDGKPVCQGLNQERGQPAKEKTCGAATEMLRPDAIMAPKDLHREKTLLEEQSH